MNLTTKKRAGKQLNPSHYRHSINIYAGIALNFKVVKRHCLDVSGYRIQLDAYWLLLILSSVGKNGISSFTLHCMYCFGFSSIGLRNTQNRLTSLIRCGLVVRSSVNGSFRYILSFQAEKLLFSGIDKESLLELSAMVKQLQDADKAKAKGKKKAVKKVVKSVK